ncbi:hypothetical protein BH10PSE14_BH10PSE14_20570 [soil metagenome]|uniref:hypothetical protein n=1 Tax=Sphingomonas sp. AR_OL41 TaxID=3042729 RepID=UPI00247FDD18|nr:hypothetical protein [Sphingomonas sp. AR_OL41]MDH7972555.1 hypothetical protein [Sphingomonas sp. AR_OL41]
MSEAGRLNVVRCAATGAALLSAIFVLCWLAAALFGAIGSHMYMAMFTPTLPGSFIALAAGLCWSILFGAVAGGVLAVFYNLFGR